MIPWVRKYMPKRSFDIPQSNAVSQLKSFIENFKGQKKKAALIYGPTGTCKSCAVYAIAAEHKFEVVEVNASDTRNADQIKEKVGNAIKQHSLLYDGKIILVDDVDIVSGRKDRGGVQALASLIADSAFPIIMTANDPWHKKFNKLRKKSLMIEFETLNHLSIYQVLKGICEEECIDFDDTSLRTLARHAGGDLRGAINDLQTLTQQNKKLTKEILDEVGDRNQIESVHQALIKIFKNSDPLIALNAFDSVNIDLDQCMLWIDYNLPKEYKHPHSIARAYDALSKADVYRGRIRRWQHWRFLVYVNALISAGVAVAKDAKSTVPASYKQTTRLLKIWQANMKYAQRKSVAQKIAEKTHCSISTAAHNLPFLQEIFKRNPSRAALIADELELDNKEVEWMKK